MVVVLMGVSGTGKTTVGKVLAAQPGWSFVEGDEFHPAENIEKMNAGIPLNDDDRHSWLQALRQHVDDACEREERVVLACSALKQEYRVPPRATRHATNHEQRSNSDLGIGRTRPNELSDVGSDLPSCPQVYHDRTTDQKGMGKQEDLENRHQDRERFLDPRILRMINRTVAAHSLALTILSAISFWHPIASHMGRERRGRKPPRQSHLLGLLRCRRSSLSRIGNLASLGGILLAPPPSPELAEYPARVGAAGSPVA